ncbi:uncharacterized protein LOC144581566 [Callithrix jacchus]
MCHKIVEAQGLRCSSHGSGQTGTQRDSSSMRDTVRDAIEVSRHRRIKRPRGKSVVGTCHGLALRDMDESGEHHPQQTDTRTENETPHILTHRWVMKNENTWTQREEY